jgi:hypothetical protein
MRCAFLFTHVAGTFLDLNVGFAKVLEYLLTSALTLIRVIAHQVEHGASMLFQARDFFLREVRIIVADLLDEEPLSA